jgi:excisionase family DNA binding protein
MGISNATVERGRSLHKAAKRRQAPVPSADLGPTTQLYEALRRGQVKLVSPRGDARPLPDSPHAFLAELIELLNEGKSVMIVQDHANLTTMQAAEMLGVSRQFLVNLLEKGEIPHHMVGTHRRIYAQDLFRYKTHRDQQRHNTIRELAQAEAKDGLYGRSVPVDAD